MADGISFDRYIDNPSGGQVITNRKMYKDLYTSKFNKVLVKEEGNIQFRVYHHDNKYDEYYIHMKIPSEVLDKFYYDVVVQLSTTEAPKKVSNFMRSYMVRFFSNDPAFVYTFAHAFSKNDLFIKDLEPKMNKQALKKDAKIKNPKNDIFYVKSLYFAYLTMERYNLFDRRVLNRNAIKYNKKILLNEIENANKKIEDRIKLGKQQEKENKESKSTSPTTNRNINNSVPITKTRKVSKITPKTKTVKSVKKSKVIGNHNSS